MKYSITIESEHPTDLQKVLATLANLAMGGTVMPSISGNPLVTPMPDDDEDNLAAPAVIQPGELDATGLPWDERIHSGAKSKNADGKWKKRKNVDEATTTAVEGELRARAAAMTAPGVVPPPAAVAPVTPPPAAPVVVPPPAAPVVAHDPIAAAVADGWIAHPTSPGYYYKGQEVVTTEALAAKYPAPAAAPSAPAAPVAAPTGPKTFTDLMQAISAGVAANKIDTEGTYIAQLAAALGVGQITEIAANPDKITEAFGKLTADGKL